MKNILDLNNIEAREFLLKQESYINIDLPPYIQFDKLITKLSTVLKDKKNINNLKKNIPREDKPNKTRNIEPKEFDDINYKIFHNKNGKYDWRPFELIHPLLYVNLVYTITEESNWNAILGRFKYIDIKSNINCMSMPVVSENNKSDKVNQIRKWWQNIEQKSLELSLDFNYIYHTDIANCYGSIYTHSIPWALHSKSIAKKRIGHLVGDKIDSQIQAMSFGQTNGIPQGSVLMDFIAEIVLKYADLQLSDRLHTLKLDSEEYKILRYRDDYRIFVNNTEVADLIIKSLTEVLIDLGLKLNAQKTIASSNIIQSSIKPDKLNWLMVKNDNVSLQKRLLLLHKYSIDNVNNSILMEELQNIFNIINKKTTVSYKNYFKSVNFTTEKLTFNLLNQMSYLRKFSYPLKNKKQRFQSNENIIVLLSIVVDIAFLNPKTYSISSAIISQLIGHIDEKEQRNFITKMMKKFSSIPNTGHMQIWVQRAIRQFQKNFETSLYDFEEPICKLVNGEDIQLWNNDWLIDDIKQIFDSNSIIDDEIINNLPVVIRWNEVLLFGEKSL